MLTDLGPYAINGTIAWEWRIGMLKTKCRAWVMCLLSTMLILAFTFPAWAMPAMMNSTNAHQHRLHSDQVQPNNAFEGNCGTSYAWLTKSSIDMFDVQVGATCTVGMWESVTYSWALYYQAPTGWIEVESGSGGDRSVMSTSWSDEFATPVTNGGGQYKIEFSVTAYTLLDDGTEGYCYGAPYDDETVDGDPIYQISLPSS